MLSLENMSLLTNCIYSQSHFYTSPTFWIQLQIRNYRKPLKLFKRFMLNKIASPVEANAWNNIPDEASPSPPSLTPDLGKTSTVLLKQRPPSSAPEASSQRVKQLWCVQHRFCSRQVPAWHEVGGAVSKGWTETIINGSRPPWIPSARAEFTCYICSGN